MTKTLFDRLPAEDGQAFNAGWIITVPWAFWSQYVVTLTDLTTPMPGVGPPIIYMPNATHEVVVEALNPEHSVTELKIKRRGSTKLWRLMPPNHAYQFIAADDAAAEARIQHIVDLIDAKELSPDTDFRHVWDMLFTDGVSLRRVPILGEVH